MYASDDDKDNSNNTKIEGASVTLIKNDYETKWNAITDGNGYYRIESIPYGKYTILVEKDEFEPYENEFIRIEDSEKVKK